VRSIVVEFGSTTEQAIFPVEPSWWFQKAQSVFRPGSPGSLSPTFRSSTAPWRRGCVRSCSDQGVILTGPFTVIAYSSRTDPGGEKSRRW